MCKNLKMIRSLKVTFFTTWFWQNTVTGPLLFFVIFHTALSMALKDDKRQYLLFPAITTPDVHFLTFSLLHENLHAVPFKIRYLCSTKMWTLISKTMKITKTLISQMYQNSSYCFLSYGGRSLRHGCIQAYISSNPAFTGLILTHLMHIELTMIIVALSGTWGFSCQNKICNQYKVVGFYCFKWWTLL